MNEIVKLLDKVRLEKRNLYNTTIAFQFPLYLKWKKLSNNF